MTIPQLHNFSLFKDVEQSVIDEVLGDHSTLSLPSDMYLIRKDGYNNKVFLLLEGEVTITDKNDKLFKSLGAGAIFGEISVLDAKPASASVTTLTDCKVLVVTEEEIWSLSKQSHTFTSNMLQLVVERLRSFSNQLDQTKDSFSVMQKKAYMDATTGLLNRIWLQEKSPRIIDYYTQKQEPLSLIMLDIDRFKDINDTYGFAAGDRVLKQVALIIQGSIKGKHYAVRLSGDDMGLIVPDLPQQEIADIAEKTRQFIEKTSFKIENGESLKISASFGVAFLDSTMSFSDLMKQADIALHSAQEAGRNQVVIAEQSLAAAAV